MRIDVNDEKSMFAVIRLSLQKYELMAPMQCTKLTRVYSLHVHGAANPGLFRTVEPNSPRTVYGLPLYRFDSFYIVYMVPNTIFHHDKVHHIPCGRRAIPRRHFPPPCTAQARLCQLLPKSVLHQTRDGKKSISGS